MLEECDSAMKLELGDHAAPKEVMALDVLSSIILRIVTRFIAGTQISRDQAFLNSATGYFGGNFLTGFIMLYLPFPPFLRDIVAWPLWKYHLKFHQQRLIEMIMPVMAKRMQEHEQGVSKHVDGEYDAIQTLLDLIPELSLDEDAAHSPVHVLSHEILQLLWAAGQSPTISIAAALFKMLAEPSYLAALRSEAEETVKRNGWTEQILNELPIMDSLIREVHRFHPAFSRWPKTVLTRASECYPRGQEPPIYLPRRPDSACGNAHCLCRRGSADGSRLHCGSGKVRRLPLCETGKDKRRAGGRRDLVECIACELQQHDVRYFPIREIKTHG